ncbi:guanine deaminase [Uliginosibacterium gangwonense]|uniref:guanine deaminase n=1 Tax=Uliginosibacterium gangwonense TaxID=392736 RepID=UPI0003755F6D|nr:guanine deaminase [Uliginosibacterium gangwonense]
MTEQHSEVLVRASILHFLRDPGTDASPSAWEYFEDGALYIVDGCVRACGPWQAICATYPHVAQHTACHVDYSGKLLIPGFVDCHVHYPQTAVMGAYGKQLLDWLTHYTFPAEAAFADPATAHASAEHFIQRLLAHGTTTASVYATVHAHSVDAFFEAASHYDLRMLCGKIMMDRHCPENLRDTAESSERDSAALIERWHNKGRLRYSITPRFAPTSTEAQLDAAARLYTSHPDVHLQSHLSENHGEIQWVRELFPNCAHYTDVYRHHGLLGPRAIYGHGIHLSDAELDMLAAHGSAIAFCPTSNRFLGSGHFDASKTLAAGVKVGLATDVGGGTSLSMLRTMNAAYEVSMTTATPLNPWRLWYLASLGGAAALGLDQFIGNFEAGHEADFTVLDFEATPDLAWRIHHCKTLEERLFALMTLGDERCVVATHALGKATTRLK